MREKIIFLTICLTAGMVQNLSGQDSLINDKHQIAEVVISSTRFKLLKEEDGRSVFRISAKDLERHAGKTLAEILSEVPGLHVDGSYAAEGSNLSYYLRGGKNGQILILIDGIPVNDPSDISSAFDFRQLDIDDIESIEIVKGGMSTLYGSDAIAGVISITLKKAAAKPFQGIAKISAGSYRTLSANLNINGSSNHFNYLVNMSFYGTGGFSAAFDSNSTPLIDSSFSIPVRNFDKDALMRQNVLSKFNYSFNKHFDVSAMLKLDNYRASIDNGAFSDDVNRSYSSRAWLLNIMPKWTFDHGESALNISWNNINRYDRNDSSEYIASPPLYSYLNGFTRSHYSGSNIQMEWTNKVSFGKYIKTISGILFKKASYGSENTTYGDWTSTRAGLPVGNEVISPANAGNTQFDPFANILLSTNFGLHLSAGARLNVHSDYGSHFVWSFNPSYLIAFNDKVKLKYFISASTSFEAPSLYQLYSIYGNPALFAASSLNYESGLVLYANDLLELGADIFSRNESNRIIFGLNGYENGGSRVIQGMEYYFDWMLLNNFKAGAGATFMRTDDSAGFYRVPRRQYTAYINYNVKQSSNIALRFTYTGDRYHYDWNTASEMILPAYSFIDLNVNHRFDKGLELFGAINNILNQQMISIYGFSSKGRNFTLGARYNFK